MKEKNIGRLISILYRQRQTYMNYALKDLNISSAEYIYLITLYNNNEGINQEELSSLLLIDKGATARAIKSLEEKGFVIRIRDDKDRRANKVFTTDKGKASKEIIKSAIQGWTELLTSDIEDVTVKIVFDTLKTMTEKVGSIDYKELFQYRGEGDEGDK